MAAGVAVGLFHERRQRIGPGDACCCRPDGETREHEACDGEYGDGPQWLPPPIPEAGCADDRDEAHEGGRGGTRETKLFGHDYGGRSDHATECE